MSQRIPSAPAPHPFQVRPRKFVFFDKETGTERFHLAPTPQGTLPIDQAASMMAIHCLVRGCSPKDFGVMVAPEEDLLQGLLPIATRLVEACAQKRSPIHLSRRQREVLRALVANHTNKEIAVQLHLSVRTVKFHVSALLEKFNVDSRVCLMRKAADIFAPEVLPQAMPLPQRNVTLLRANGEPASARRPDPLLLRMAAGQRASR